MLLELIWSELWGPCWFQIPLSQSNLWCISPGQAFPYPRTPPPPHFSLSSSVLFYYSAGFRGWLMASDVDARLLFCFPTYHCKRRGKEEKGNALHGAGEGSSWSLPCKGSFSLCWGSSTHTGDTKCFGVFGTGAWCCCILLWGQTLC